MEWVRESLLTIALILGAIASIITALEMIRRKVINPFVERVKNFAERLEAGNELVAAQLQVNGGGSLLDKVNKISMAQDADKALQDERHEENSVRLDDLERGMEEMNARLSIVEVRTEYSSRLLIGLPHSLTPEGQAQWRKTQLEAEAEMARRNQETAG